MNIYEQVRRDELRDRAELFGLMPVREFAEYIGVAPQLVYYRIRNKRIQKHVCKCCGQPNLIDVKEALGTFPGKAKALQAEEEESGEDLVSD